MSTMPPLNALRSFEATARLGSISAAADELHVTAGAVSKQIRALEQSVGGSLFERSARGLRLTPEGRMLAKAAHEAFEVIREATRSIRPDTVETINVTTVASIASQWLIPRARALEQATGAKLNVRTGVEFENLDHSAVDFALRFGLGEWDGAVAAQLGPGAHVVVASPALAEELGEVREPIDLLGAPLLASSHYEYWGDLFAAAGQVVPRTADRRVFQDYNVMMEATQHGAGVAILPLLLVSDCLKAGRVVRLLPALSATPARRYYVAHAASKRLRREARAAIDWLLAEAERIEPV